MSNKLEEAWKEHHKRINASDIELASDIAWEEKIKPNCKCGADSRVECRCSRNNEFKERAAEIRERWFGSYWGESIKLAMGLLYDSQSAIEHP